MTQKHEVKQKTNLATHRNSLSRRKMKNSLFTFVQMQNESLLCVGEYRRLVGLKL